MSLRGKVRFSLVLVLAVLVPQPAVSTGSADVIVQGIERTSQAAAAVRSVGGRVTASLPIVSGVAATVPSRALARLGAEPGVRAVTPNERVHVAGPAGPANPQTVKSVFAREVGADRLWKEGVDGRGVRIAIIDTGVSPVRDLADRLVAVPDPLTPGATAPCADLSGENSCADTYGHGTFVAGLMAGTGASSAGRFTGVAPGAEIVSVKIAGRDGSADVTKVLAAIQYVVSFSRELNIRVLNLSLGTTGKASYRIDPLNFAVQRAWRAGIAVVVSAGNLGPGAKTISKPADDPLVITVGAVDDRETPATSDDRLPRFSARGPTYTDGLAKPDVVAPGGRVVSLRSDGSYIEEHAPASMMPVPYRRGSGTSMSAGVVSGAAALVLQANPAWTPDRLKFAFAATAQKVAARDPLAVGAGLVDAYRAARLGVPGLANQDVTTLSDASGLLDVSRDAVRVLQCADANDPGSCAVLEGERTAQGKAWDVENFQANWDGSSWYDGQWAIPSGTSWYGSSWYDPDAWMGSSWQGSSWYGNDDGTAYGTPVQGSSWYGAWE